MKKEGSIQRYKMDQRNKQDEKKIPAVGFIQPPLVPGFLPGVKRPKRHIHHSLPSGAEINDEWDCTSPRPICFMTWTRTLLFAEDLK
jgi:hypothetical protein